MRYLPICVRRCVARPAFFAVLFVSAAFGLFAQTADIRTAVYATKTGQSYHRDGCSALSRSRLPVTLGEAAASGLAPCNLCSPPVLEAGVRAKILQTASAGLYKVNVEGLASYTKADTSKMLRARVTRHVDGDTVELRFANPQAGIAQVEKIRMIGVDTPETVHPQKGVEFFGKEASEYTKKNLLNKDVYIALDWELRDKYKRLLVYIYKDDGSCHNALLIQQGYAHAYTRFPFQFMNEFRELERASRAAQRGLWGYK
ncbi:MAG: thermonuclease family protein [Spirochaetaceae bacterium]|jgi:micrococcal nuclease|nr:thermonuclease family protein [Spirochaetaceae bacterium]